MNSPKITVATVVFNSVSTIEETIQSVINQTYSNIEYVIIDGKSTDGTLDVIEKYREKISVLVSEPDKGIYDAMNKALRHASGDYLIFMGADDVFMTNDTLSQVSNYLLQNNRIYYGDVQLKYQNEIWGGYFSKFRFSRMNPSHQAIFYSKDLYKNLDYDLYYKQYADYVYNMKLFHEDNSRFEYMPVCVSLFNDSGCSVSGDPRFFEDRWKLIRKYFGLGYMIVDCLGHYVNIVKRFVLRQPSPRQIMAQKIQNAINKENQNENNL